MADSSLTRARRAPRAALRATWTDALPAALFAAAVAAIIAIQIPLSLQMARTVGFLGAREGRWAIIVDGVVIAVTALLALLVPRRFLWAAIAPGALALATAAVAVAAPGGEAWSMTAAALTFTAAWLLGRVILSVPSFRRESFRDDGLVTLTVGLGALAVIVLLLGRAGVLRWWTVGLVTIAAGAAGAVMLARGRGLGAPRALLVSLTESRPRAAAAGSVCLQGAFAAIWAGAPEIRYDALFYKAWLPAHWAESGRIETSIDHPFVNLGGLVEVVAVPGHLISAASVGRFLELFAFAIIVAAAWRFGDRVGRFGGPLAALLVAIVPQAMREVSTAQEGLLLCLLCLGAARAALHFEDRDVAHPFAASLVLGFTCGACVFGKLYIAMFGLALGFTWLLLSRSARELGHRLAGTALGLAVSGAPLYVIHWVDAGNPVFPFLNDIFKSPYYPAVSDTLGLGELSGYDEGGGGGASQPGGIAASWLIWRVLHNSTSSLADPMAAGVFALLPAAFALALLFGWRGAGPRRAVWGALAIALTTWWVLWRYDRFTYPYSAVAVALALPALGWLARPRERGGRRRLATVSVLAGAVAAAVFFVPALASFWNVPGRVPLAVAVGRQAEDAYEREAIQPATTLQVFNRLAEPGATLLGDGEARALLRPDIELVPGWELASRLYLEKRLPIEPAALQRLLSVRGVHWLVLAKWRRTLEDTEDDLGQLAREHGEIVFADRLYDLYRLVERPATPQPAPLCDESFEGVGCWYPTDRVVEGPGLTDAEAKGLPVTQTIPACPGATYSVSVSTAPGEDETRVYLTFNDPDPLQAVRYLDMPPGRTTVLHVTAPPDARTASITVDTLGPTAAVERVGLGLSGEAVSRCSP